MLAERVFVPLFVGNLLGLASVVAWSSVPAEPAQGPPAAARITPPKPALAAAAVVATTSAPHHPEVIAGLELREPAADLLDPGHFAFVVDIDGEPYVQLAPYLAHTPKHGPAHFTTSTAQPDQKIAYAHIAKRAMPAEWKSWLGMTMVVDGNCRARIDGFALRDGKSGDTVDAMSAAELLGDSPALVAHLDGCAGGKVARDAALTAAQPAIRDDGAADAPSLIALANADLRVSELGRKDMAIYDDGVNQNGSAQAPVEVITAVVVHPVTKARYVVVQLRLGGESCGEPNFTLNGVYRDAGNGDLTRLWIGEGAMSVDLPMVDLLNDGSFELIGERGVETLRGKVLATRVGDLYLGCPC